MVSSRFPSWKAQVMHSCKSCIRQGFELTFIDMASVETTNWIFIESLSLMKRFELTFIDVSSVYTTNWATISSFAIKINAFNLEKPTESIAPLLNLETRLHPIQVLHCFCLLKYSIATGYVILVWYHQFFYYLLDYRSAVLLHSGAARLRVWLPSSSYIHGPYERGDMARHRYHRTTLQNLL